MVKLILFVCVVVMPSCGSTSNADLCGSQSSIPGGLPLESVPGGPAGGGPTIRSSAFSPLHPTPSQSSFHPGTYHQSSSQLLHAPAPLIPAQGPSKFEFIPGALVVPYLPSTPAPPFQFFPSALAPTYYMAASTSHEYTYSLQQKAAMAAAPAALALASPFTYSIPSSASLQTAVRSQTLSHSEGLHSKLFTVQQPPGPTWNYGASGNTYGTRPSSSALLQDQVASAKNRLPAPRPILPRFAFSLSPSLKSETVISPSIEKPSPVYVDPNSQGFTAVVPTSYASPLDAMRLLSRGLTSGGFKTIVHHNYTPAHRTVPDRPSVISHASSVIEPPCHQHFAQHDIISADKIKKEILSPTSVVQVLPLEDKFSVARICEESSKIDTPVDTANFTPSCVTPVSEECNTLPVIERSKPTVISTVEKVEEEDVYNFEDEEEDTALPLARFKTRGVRKRSFIGVSAESKRNSSVSPAMAEKAESEKSESCARTAVVQWKKRSKHDPFDFLASPHRLPPPLEDSDDDSDEEPPSRIAKRNSLVDRDLHYIMEFYGLKDSVKHSVGVYRSKIHSRGVYAKRLIEQGEMVIEYAGEVIRSVLTDKRERRYQARGIGCYMFRVDEEEVVDATMHGNAARFINHSCEPNCYSKSIEIFGKKHIVIYSLRRIKRGEELTYDYKFPKEEVKIPCACGARRCRRFLN